MNTPGCYVEPDGSVWGMMWDWKNKEKLVLATHAHAAHVT